MKEAHLVKADEKIKPIIYKIWRLNKSRLIFQIIVWDRTPQNQKKETGLELQSTFYLIQVV